MLRPMIVRMARLVVVAAATLAVASASLPALAQSRVNGAVVMHGKGGSPARIVSDLADALAAKGFVVANLEMPWSGSRAYDVDTAHADKEVEAAIAGLKAKGAGRIFVIGHSQGGAFALHFASVHPVDGIVAIAPGGSVDGKIYLEQVGESLARARRLVAEGKGGEKQRFDDYEGSRQNFSVVSPSAAYVTWFDPLGAMSMTRSLREFPASVPVLWVSPTGDYPGLRKSSRHFYAQLPRNPLHRYVEPDASHLGAPKAAIPDILAWTAAVAATPR